MKVPTKILFEDAAQEVLALLKRGIALEVACNTACNDVAQAHALKSYVETHYSATLAQSTVAA